MNRILIAGAGYVGKAYHKLINQYEYSAAHLKDPYKDINDIEYAHSDAVIICVSTPSNEYGECNVQHVMDVIAECPRVPILIKSTISIEGWRIIRKTFPYADITFSPEFLRAEHAYEDLCNNTELLAGGDNVKYWYDLFSLGNINNVLVATPDELILAKYFRNTFLATKVSFFNQVYDLCKSLDINFDAVRKGIVQDHRIGDSHSEVTATRGYGGHCFPKDTSALLATANTANVDLSIIKESAEYNKRIRKV